jgi:thioredoxin-related protein
MKLQVGRSLWQWCAGLGLLATTSALAYAQATQESQPAKTETARPSIYDKNADATAALAKASERANRENKRVLLMFGGDWCGWCHKLHTLFKTDPEIRKLLSYEYELVMVDTKAPNAEKLLEECSKGQTGVGFPFLAVMDGAGKLLVGQKTDPLEEGDHHDPAKVKEFLGKWVAEPKDAEAVLRDALSKTASDDKGLFLTFGAPWCGWCHRLEDFLNRPEISAIMSRDFNIVKIDIDRMTHGAEILKKYRPDEGGGIPWFAILDAKGEVLGTADRLNGPQKNIGYPAAPEEIDAFMSLIEGQTKRIEPAQVAQLRSELKEAGDKIMAEMKQRAAARQAAEKE